MHKPITGLTQWKYLLVLFQHLQALQDISYMAWYWVSSFYYSDKSSQSFLPHLHCLLYVVIYCMYSKSVQGPWSGITTLLLQTLHLAIKSSTTCILKSNTKTMTKNISILDWFKICGYTKVIIGQTTFTR